MESTSQAMNEQKAKQSKLPLKTILIAAPLIIGLLIIIFGPCSVAVWVAKAVPDTKYWKRELIAQQLMQWIVQTAGRCHSHSLLP
jgi:hypothetical protein